MSRTNATQKKKLADLANSLVLSFFVGLNLNPPQPVPNSFVLANSTPVSFEITHASRMSQKYFKNKSGNTTAHILGAGVLSGTF